jgi:hypothetical protein
MAGGRPVTRKLTLAELQDLPAVTSLRGHNLPA